MKISIITPTFNSAGTVADTLRSIDRQTGVSVEHLIMDGVSNDSTADVIAGFSRPWRRFHSAPDRGLYDAMNGGLRMVHGDIVGFLNSDDFYPSDDVLSTIAFAFSENPELDAVYGDLCYVKHDSPDQVVRYWRSESHRAGMFRKGWVPPHPTFFARRSVYEEHGGFDLRYSIAADWELLARLIEVKKIRARHISKVLVHMRLGGLTNRSWRNIWKQNVEIWSAMQAHGLAPSLPGFIGHKIWSRGLQFVSRA